MIFIVVVLVIIIMILFSRLFYTKKQIKNIQDQLTDINKNKSDKKITVGLVNREIEELAKTINDTIDIIKRCEISKFKLQNELKQTIANMSHDLRTPLTSIIGYIQFCKLDNIEEEEKKEYLMIAEQRAKNLEILLNDFYELSLVESLDLKLKLEKVSISRVLQEILLGRYADFMNRKLEPNIEISNDNIFIIAEKKSLERIIENLLTNAIKYAKDNLKIYLGVVNSKVLLRISNTVDNLSSEDVDKIFDRFYMADKTRSGRGTGLGLSIVKSLIEKMGGSISADKNKDILNIYCTFKHIE